VQSANFRRVTAESLFHAQQCAEKALKALLTWHQIRFSKTHELDVLTKLSLPVLSTPISQLETVGSLTQYAWRFRYPGAPYEPQREEAEEARRMASGFLEAISAQLDIEFSRL
jgi:HEPN domain-containing protein